jgi:hypothetical protein
MIRLIGLFEVSPNLQSSEYFGSQIVTTLCKAPRWLDNCVRNHLGCTVPDSSFKPRRLIYVGDHHSSPMLMESNDVGSPYAALSYCWGLVDGTLKTTRTNLSEHLKGIDVRLAPKVCF